MFLCEHEARGAKPINYLVVFIQSFGTEAILSNMGIGEKNVEI